MPGCSLLNCTNSTKKYYVRDISYHRFPNNPNIRRKWIAATGRPKGWSPTKHSRICSAHFQESSFTGTPKYRRILSIAYPTIDIATRNDEVDCSQNTDTSTLSEEDSAVSSAAEDPDTSDSEIETVVVKVEPDTEEEEEQSETETIKAKRPKLDNVRIQEDIVERSVPFTPTSDAVMVLVPDNILKMIMITQNEMLDSMKNQVLMQNPDPKLMTFLRFLGGKLQTLPKDRREDLQDRVIAMVLKEYEETL